MRSVLLPVIAGALFLGGCGYSEDPLPTPAPVIVADQLQPSPVPDPPSAECGSPDVTYFFAANEDLAASAAWHLIAADRIIDVVGGERLPWAIVVGEMAVPEPWLTSPGIPPDPHVIALVSFGTY